MTRLRLLALLAVLFAALAAPAAARASLTVTTSTPQAGAPATTTVDASFASDPTGGPVVLHLPAGLVGNPGPPFTECSETAFDNDSCPASSRVGTTSANGLGALAAGDIFNLVPHADEPARLGITVNLLGLASLAHNEASVHVRPDGGLDSTISSLESPLAVSSLQLVLNSDFITMPTSCGIKTVTMDAAGTSQSGQFPVTGCDHVPFTPSAQISVANPQRVQPSGYTVTINVPNTGNPRQSHVRSTTVVLPEGTTLSPGIAPGLQACTTAQFNGSGCPAASQIGTVRFATPLLAQPLNGKVFFGVPANGVYSTLVAVDDHGVHLRLPGKVTLDQSTGQITTVFDDLPQVPFTQFALTFNGGDRAVLANPGTCGTKTLAATLTPWSGTAPRTIHASFNVTGCQSPEPFRPKLAVSSTSTAAGRPAGALAITISRPDGDQDVARVETLLPPGLAGSLTGVPICPDADAKTGACPANTRLGSVTALVGTGGAPVTLNGTVYLTGPAEGGLAGLAIVIPGKVGPVDLGTVVVRAGLLLRSSDGGVTVRTAPLPSMVGGVPTAIRSLTLRLDRPGFAVNPSGCDLRTVVANLTGSGGSTATATAPYQATDCAGLLFQPRLTARIAHRGPKGARTQPKLRTVITIPPGQSSTSSASVQLPKQMALELQAIKAVCTHEQALADACPAASRVGTVNATTPLLPVPLSGPVYMVQMPGSLFPGLRLALGGPVQLRLDGALNLGKTITAVFSGIPDVPLSRFTLTFGGGGPVKVFGNPCTGPLLRFAGTLTGHNGATANTPAKAFVTGCPATASKRRSHGRLRIVAGHGRDAKKLKSVSVRLPRGVTAHGVRATQDGKRVKRSAIRVHRHTITLRLHRARRATLILARGRPHGRFTVKLTRTNGRHFTVRLR